jgi:hypothetical protein
LRVRIGRVLVSLLTVPIRGFGVLPGRFIFADLVVMGGLDVVMSGGCVVSGGPVVVLGWSALPGRRRCGCLGSRGHGSILLWDCWSRVRPRPMGTSIVDRIPDRAEVV